MTDAKKDCDQCKQDCRRRLLIMDQQLERLEKATGRQEVMIEAMAEALAASHPEIFMRKINELTARILAKGFQEGEIKQKGPADEPEDKDIADWH